MNLDFKTKNVFIAVVGSNQKAGKLIGEIVVAINAQDQGFDQVNKTLADKEIIPILNPTAINNGFTFSLLV